MSQIFPKEANWYPLYTLIGVSLGGVFLIGFVWYYFSPWYTEVGYKPDQPVPYSHQVHVQKLGMDCQYCHTNVDKSPHANVPSTQICMNCHSQVRTDAPSLANVRESWESGEPVEWVNVHMLPDYVQFNHSSHVEAGVGCETCHGRVDQMDVASQQKPLSMGWCMDCHRNAEENLRPPEEVTTMGWEPDSNQVQKNRRRMLKHDINPPTKCSTCHY